jgi:hypothetical protein
MAGDAQFRRLTHEVINPTYDGRKKYGIDAVRSFPAGMPFLFSPGVGMHPAAAETGRGHYITGTLAELLFDASVRAVPMNVLEVGCALGHRPHVDTLAEVFDATLARYRLTPVDVLRVWRDLEAAEGAQERAEEAYEGWMTVEPVAEEAKAEGGE